MNYLLSRAPFDVVYHVVSVRCLACLVAFAPLCTPLIHPAEALSFQFAVEPMLNSNLLRQEDRVIFAAVGSLSSRSLSDRLESQR